MEVNLRLATAKAQTRAEAHDEIIALTSELEEWKKGLTASKEESIALKEQLETTTTELAKANKELKLSQEALEAAGMQLAATKARLDGKTTELESTESELKLAQETLERAATHLVATKARLDGKTTELEGVKAELDSEQTARQRLEGELAVTREALVASNKKLAIGLTLAKLLFLFLALIVVFWSLGTSSQLPLAVVSRIDSAHMYPEEMSEAWLTMDEFGWFG